jgi:hypothetical protein
VFNVSISSTTFTDPWKESLVENMFYYAYNYEDGGELIWNLVNTFNSNRTQFERKIGPMYSTD